MNQTRVQIPFADLSRTHTALKNQFLEITSKLIDSSSFILGQEVTEFEKNFADFTGTRHSVGVGNGLDALKLSLKAVGVKRGDKVIVPAHTFTATWMAVADLGAVPVACDVYPHTYNLNIQSNTIKTVTGMHAIIPVHIYGLPCEMDEILNMADENSCFVIEDNAQAQGAIYKGKNAGSMGHVNATSFYPGKNLGALGDAGAITTNDDLIALKLRSLRNYGSVKKYEHDELGYNSRLDNLQAAYLNIKLNYLKEWIAERNRIALRYKNNLSGLTHLQFQHTPENCLHTYHLLTVLSDRRNDLQKHLSNQGIQTIIHYPTPPHLQQAFQELGYRKGDFPIAEQIAEQTLSLPLFIGITNSEVDDVCEAIIDFFAKG
ncbi:MAG: DegT/DnrJ/EryC1/StrS family aminotransferase [Chitinophagales bacterium]